MSLREELSELMRIRKNLESSSMGEPPTSPADIYAWCEEAAQFITAHGQALLDALEDAERYRWLKDKGIVRAHPMKALFKGETRIFADASRWIAGDFTYVVKGEIGELDQAIDAAIKVDG